MSRLDFTYTGSSLLGSVAFRYNPSAGGKNYHFLPYGLEWPGETPDATTNLKWTGHQYDSDSGLYHFLFRDYAPLENRWLSPDPAGWAVGNPGNPQSWNRYSYATDSACAATDPLGLFHCKPGTHLLTPEEVKSVMNQAQRWNAENSATPDYEHLAYKYGGTGKSGVIDCSHFVDLLFSDAHLTFPLFATWQLAGSGYVVPDATPRPGDIMLMITASEQAHDKSGHEGVFLGGTKWVNSESTGGTRVRNTDSWVAGAFGAAPVFLRPCVKDKSTAAGAPGGGGFRGGHGSLSFGAMLTMQQEGLWGLRMDDWDLIDFWLDNEIPVVNHNIYYY